MKLFIKLLNAACNTFYYLKATDEKHIVLEKGQAFISESEQNGYKVIHTVTKSLVHALQQSTLEIRCCQLYAHFQLKNKKGTTTLQEDPTYTLLEKWHPIDSYTHYKFSNEYKDYCVRTFVFEGATDSILLNDGLAIPVTTINQSQLQHTCSIEELQYTVTELNNKGLITYVQPITLSNKNKKYLKDTLHYLLLLDTKMAQYYNGYFYCNQRPIPIYILFAIGALQLVKKCD